MKYRYFIGEIEVEPTKELRDEYTKKIADAFGMKIVKKGSERDGKDLHMEIET